MCVLYIYIYIYLYYLIKYNIILFWGWFSNWKPVPNCNGVPQKWGSPNWTTNVGICAQQRLHATLNIAGGAALPKHLICAFAIPRFWVISVWAHTIVSIESFVLSVASCNQGSFSHPFPILWLYACCFEKSEETILFPSSLNASVPNLALCFQSTRHTRPVAFQAVHLKRITIPRMFNEFWFCTFGF